MDKLPNNLDAERNLIGLCLLDGHIPQSAKALDASDFYDVNYRSAWHSFLELDQQGKEIEPFTAYDIISNNGASPTFKMTDLANTSHGMIHGVNERVWVNQLKECSLKRYLIKELTNQISALTTESGADVIRSLKAKIDELEIHSEATGGFRDLAEIIDKDVMPALDDLHNRKHDKIPTGFHTIDNVIGGGLSMSDLLLVAGVPGSGKALALDTSIPTPTGWTTMGLLQQGDEVFDEQGQICKVVAATPVMENRPCFRVEFSDGAVLVADADHQWLTSTWKARRSASNARRNNRIQSRPLALYGSDQTHKRTLPSVITTSQIKETLRTREDQRLNHSVNVTLPLDLPEVALPVPPYVLGAWLGDGKTLDGRFYTMDSQIIHEIELLGFEINRNAGHCAYGIQKLKVPLRALGVLGKKHIPPIYLRASISQRLALLQGLMDTDGYCTKNGYAEFTTTKALLKDGVIELIQSLGIKANAKKGVAKLNSRVIGDKWRIGFVTDLPVFRLERKLVRLKRDGFRGTHNVRFITAVDQVESVPVKCIEVDSPSRLYLAGTSFIPTHNSAFVLQMAANIAEAGTPIAFLSGEMTDKENIFRLLTQKYKIPNLNSLMHITATEKEGLEEWATELKKLPMYFDSKTYDLASISKAMHGLIEAKQVKVLVIDYIQLLKLDRNKRQDRYERITEVSQEIKRTAMEFGIAVIEVAQFNRVGAKSDKPSMHDLEGSSQLEKDTSLIFIIDRELQSENVTLRIVKGRNTGTCEIDGTYLGKYLTFEF